MSGGQIGPSGLYCLANPGALAACGHPGTMRLGGGGGRDLGALRQWWRCARNCTGVILPDRAREPRRWGRWEGSPAGPWGTGGGVGVGDRAPGCGAAVKRAPRARVGGRGVPAAPGVSPRLFFAAGAGFALFALALSLVSRGVVSIGVTRFQKPWAASFQVWSSPSQETELQTP